MKYKFESLDDIFTFGKFKGFSIQEVYQGNTKLNQNLLYEYLLDYFKDHNINLMAPWLITKVFEIDFKVDRLICKIKPEFESVFEKINQSNYTKSLFFDKSNFGNWPLINGNFSLQKFCFEHDAFENQITSSAKGAISWYIKNVDNFSVNPTTLLELQNIETYDFAGITITHRSGLEFNYTPYYEKSLFQFSEKIVELNSIKYNKATSNYLEDYPEKRTFDRYKGSYASDTMGYSDQDIDDIFDGEPDAYWNID